MEVLTIKDIFKLDVSLEQKKELILEYCLKKDSDDFNFIKLVDFFNSEPPGDLISEVYNSLSDDDIQNINDYLDPMVIDSIGSFLCTFTLSEPVFNYTSFIKETIIREKVDLNSCSSNDTVKWYSSYMYCFNDSLHHSNITSAQKERLVSDFLGVLVDAGANLEILDSDFETPIFYATRNEDVELIKAMLEHGVDLDNDIYRNLEFFALNDDILQIIKSHKSKSSLLKNIDNSKVSSSKLRKI